MRRSILAAAAAGALLLSGCSGGDDEPSVAAPGATTTAPASSGGDDHAAELKVANQGYVTALMKGDVAGVTGYLDPQACDDDDEGTLAFAVGAISKTADGATMTIKTVKIYPDGHGGADEYELSKDASDALRRLVKSSFAESKKGSWVYRDGEWYLAGPCEDDATASPSPTT